MSEEKIEERWNKDAGVAFYDDDGTETRVTDRKKSRDVEKSMREDIDEIEEE